jgi:hypothetical protein
MAAKFLRTSTELKAKVTLTLAQILEKKLSNVLITDKERTKRYWYGFVPTMTSFDKYKGQTRWLNFANKRQTNAFIIAIALVKPSNYTFHRLCLHFLPTELPVRGSAGADSSDRRRRILHPT